MMENKTKIILQGRLSGTQRNRLTRLLDMMYTPTELSEKIGFERRQVYRVYIPLGCPYQETNNGRRKWVNGKDFREWYLATYTKAPLGENETFCLTCKQAVQIINPEKNQKGRITYLLSNCPVCGRRCTRIIKNKGY